MANRGIAQRTMGDVSYTGSGGVGGVGVCTRPLQTQKRPQGDLRAPPRQDSIDAAVMARPSTSRHQGINFFGPQEVSHCSLWTISERNGTQTAACRICVPNLVCLSPSKRPPAAIVALWLANRCNLRIARLFIRPRLHGGSARASSAVYAAAARLTARAARSAARSGARAGSGCVTSVVKPAHARAASYKRRHRGRAGRTPPRAPPQRWRPRSRK